MPFVRHHIPPFSSSFSARLILRFLAVSDAATKALDTTQLPVRILINNKSAGSLIGKQGATIKAIRQDTYVPITH